MLFRSDAPTNGASGSEPVGEHVRIFLGGRLPGKLHTFRHAFISNALLKGTPVAVVREWVGHVDQQVLALYTHVHNDASPAAMHRLTEANQRLRMEETPRDGKETDSAQTQHKREESGDVNDAK